MRLRHTETVYSDIELSLSEQDEVTLHRLERIVSPGEYLRTKKDGKIWVMQDDPGHRHGSISEDDVREATELDIAVFTVMKAIRKFRSERNG
jgi:hypothetical protein